MNESARPRLRHVLITTAIVVRMPDGDDDGFTYAELFADKMREAIVDTFRGSPAVEYPGATSLAWLDESDMNVGTCAACGRWVSDYTRPETLEGIPGGRLIGGRWLCDECETFGEGAGGEPVPGNG